jgi:hypothetical protein
MRDEPARVRQVINEPWCSPLVGFSCACLLKALLINFNFGHLLIHPNDAGVISAAILRGPQKRLLHQCCAA